MEFSHIDRADKSGGVIVAGPGDSGGPVISLPGHVNVEGVIEAANPNTQKACLLYPERLPECTPSVYYFDFITQANAWGVGLKTS